MLNFDYATDSKEYFIGVLISFMFSAAVITFTLVANLSATALY